MLRGTWRLSWVVFLALASCDGGAGSTASTTDNGVCIPGQSIGCACQNGEQGAQLCNDEGTALGMCVCAGSGGGGQGGAGGEGAAAGEGGAGGEGGGTGGAGGTACTPGSTTDCYTGPAGTDGVGVCVPGAATCLADGSGYGPCLGDVTPVAETCSSPGDDDCDGMTNEEGPDCACAPGSQASCYSGPPGTLDVGPCVGGVQQCNAAGTGYGPCIGEVTPDPEVCGTMVDDDCDGQVNEEGVDCVCVPDEQAPCYTGPLGTQGVGVCQGGTQQCNPFGTAWEACTGEVTPTQDLCVTADDEDCNGSPVPCVGAVTWSKIFVTMDASDEWFGLETDGAGNVIVGLRLGNQIDLGGGPVTNVVVAKFDAAGNHLWSKGFGSVATDLAVDAGGNVVITGYFNNFIDLGGGVLFSQGGANDVFVAKYSPSGQHLWSKRFGGFGPDTAEGVAVDVDGNVVVVGAIGNQVDFGGGMLPFGGNSDFFALELDPNGNHLWSKSYGDFDTQFGLRVTTDPDKNVILGGRLWGSADFGGGMLTASPAGTDLLAVKLDSNGNHLWSKRWGDNPNQRVEAVAADSAGNVLLSGYFAGTVDFGGGTLFAGAEDDGFVVKLDPAGAYQWAKHVTGGGAQAALGVKIGVGNTVVVTGAFLGTTDLGLGSMASAGSTDAFVARLAPNGTTLWQKRYGDTGSQSAVRVAVDSADAVLVGGSTYQGAIDFGDGPLASFQTGGDLVLGKLAP
jgi:hypothetical protein